MTEQQNKWIYLCNIDADNYQMMGSALATVASHHPESHFNVVHVSLIAKYFNRLENVNIGSPDMDSEVFKLPIPAYLSFESMCRFIENALKLSTAKSINPYTGYLKEETETDRHLAKYKNIILFAFYSVLNGSRKYCDIVVPKLKEHNFTPICCGSRDEHLLKGSYDFRELIGVDQLIRNRHRISGVVTSDALIKEICICLGIRVIYVFSHALLSFDPEGKQRIEHIEVYQENFPERLINILLVPGHTQPKDDPKTYLHKFEVPYNFDEIILDYYCARSDAISYLYLPPYKDDLQNTRTAQQSLIKGHSYMPQTRGEYEYHLKLIRERDLHFLILWQQPNNVIDKNLLDYYLNLGASGFIVSNDENAHIIKTHNPELQVIGSITQCRTTKLTKEDLQFYDGIVLFYPFMRSIDSLKILESIKEKLIIMPNSFCHTECKGYPHWFIKDSKDFDPTKDCPAYSDKSKSTFIYPDHLKFFDEYVGAYKLQGREWTTDYIVTVSESYFHRVVLSELIDSQLDRKLKNFIALHSSPEHYYNINNESVQRIE